MTKRDTIQRVIVNITPDDMGGSAREIEYKEIIRAHVSQKVTAALTADGKTELTLIDVVSDFLLDDGVYTRYLFSGKLFRIMRQVKSGNEYFIVMREE